MVVGIDGSETALGAAQWAAEFAARHALALTLLHVIPRWEWHFVTGAPPAEFDQGAAGDRALAAAQAAVPRPIRISTSAPPPSGVRSPRPWPRPRSPPGSWWWAPVRRTTVCWVDTRSPSRTGRTVGGGLAATGR